MVTARTRRVLCAAISSFLLCSCAGAGSPGGNLPAPTGAATGQTTGNACSRPNEIPRVNNIGLQSFLTFEQAPGARDSKGARNEVTVPVDGRNLAPPCAYVSVRITGSVPAQPGTDYRIQWDTELSDDPNNPSKTYANTAKSYSNPDSFDVVLKDAFLSRLSTGDQITIQVTVSQPAEGPCGPRIVSFATRTFTLYTVPDYRTKVIAARIAPHDFHAFPLPDKEVEELFGPLIAQQFYVVRLSVRNTESETKLISTGMITASGRALVEAQVEKGSNACGKPAYTLPVTVVPSSLQQTYTILNDEEVTQPRSWVFRGLEFAGSLASAAAAAFGGSVVVQAIGLFTGNAIPEGKKLVPDRWPGYKSNIVQYAMQDLIKVPSNSISDHKLLFFSKKNIQGIISDQTFYLEVGRSGKTENVNPVSRNMLGFWSHNTSVPSVHVISLAFDSLDLRFEKVFDVGKLSIKDRITVLIKALPNQIDELERLDKEWASGVGRFGDRFTGQQWTDLNNLLTKGKGLKDAYINALAKVSADEKKKLEPDTGPKGSELLDQTTALVAAFAPSSQAAYRKDIITSPEYGLDALRVAQASVSQFAKALAGGAELPSESELTKIEVALTNSKRARAFYGTAADALANSELKAVLANVQSTAENASAAKPAPDQGTATGKFQDAAEKGLPVLQQLITTLNSARPNSGLNLMAAVKWPSVGGAAKEGGKPASILLDSSTISAQTGQIDLTITAPTDGKEYFVTVSGSQIPKIESATPAEVILKVVDSWKIIKGGKATLTLSGLKVGESVGVVVLDRDNKQAERKDAVVSP